MLIGVRKSLKLCVALCLLVTGAACGSGGGGGGGGHNAGAPTTQMNVTVLAPTGQLAQAGPRGWRHWWASLWGVGPAHAQVAGLMPVPGATIFIFSVDNNGNPVPGTSTLVGTTDVNGGLTFPLPKGLTLSPTLVIQAQPPNAPIPLPVCDPTAPACPPGVRLSTPAVQSALLALDPSAELGTRLLLAGGAANFTTTSTVLYIGQLQNFLNNNFQALIDHSVSGAVEKTITNIKNAASFQTQVQPILTEIQNSGQVDQTVLGGTYRYARFVAVPDFVQTPLRRAVEVGTISVNPAAGEFTVQSTVTGGKLFETCPGPTTCNRSFTLHSLTVTNPPAFGPIFLTKKGNVVTTDIGGEISVGQANAGGTLAIFPHALRTSELGFTVAVRQGSGLMATDAQGTFNEVSFTSRLSQTQVGVGPSWDNPLRSSSGTGTHTFAGGNLTLARTDSEMTRTVNCNPNMGNPCFITATFPAPTLNTLNPTTIPFTIGSDGTLNFTTSSGPQTAWLSSDKNIVLHPVADSQNPAFVAFRLGVRQAQGLTNADLTGTYSVVIFEEILTTGQNIITQVRTGTAQFNGVTTATFTTTAAFDQRTECGPPGFGCVSGFVQQDSTVTTDTPTYGVTPTGVLTITSAGGTIIPSGSTVNGTVAPDQSFIVAALQGTGVRSFLLGVKQQ
jgi:hypothetical protein